MEPLTPYDVALCMLLRSYLCPADEFDPPPHSPLHAAFGEALLAEVRRRDAVACPTLVQLLQHIQVSPVGQAWVGNAAMQSVVWGQDHPPLVCTSWRHAPATLAGHPVTRPCPARLLCALAGAHVP